LHMIQVEANKRLFKQKLRNLHNQRATRERIDRTR
jgi:hypothetical protein